MDWRDTGIVLAVRKHGETSAIVSLLTEEHGRHAGLVHGGQSRHRRGMLQPGNEVRASWRGRLSEHLGSYQLELADSHAARLLSSADPLIAMLSACALVEAGLAEGEPHPELFAGTRELLLNLRKSDWLQRYILWELVLLAELGFGLDLESCAASGVTEDLAYVSPRSGRAVSVAAGAPYRDKLLPLPPFLIDGGSPGDTSNDTSGIPQDAAALGDGLRLTGYFLDHHVFPALERKLPEPRRRLAMRAGIREEGIR